MQGQALLHAHRGTPPYAKLRRMPTEARLHAQVLYPERQLMEGHHQGLNQELQLLRGRRRGLPRNL